MDGIPIPIYAAGAIAYGTIVSVLLAGIAGLLDVRSVLRTVPALLTVTVFVFLTQHPFPSLNALNCPVPGATPNLVPLADMADDIVRDMRRGTTLKNVLTNAGVGVTLMNLLAGAAIGVTVSLHAISTRTALASGFMLSLAVELTQLTGIWGVYPCAYRKFDTDDLLTNTLGVGIGFASARRWWGVKA